MFAQSGIQRLVNFLSVAFLGIVSGTLSWILPWILNSPLLGGDGPDVKLGYFIKEFIMIYFNFLCCC